MISRAHFVAVLGAFVLISGCAHRSRTTSITTTTAASAPAEPPATGAAHALVIQTASCWLGGLWSDAIGEQGDAPDAAIRNRCLDVVQAVGGPASVSYYPLRAVDTAAVGQIAEQLRMLA